MQTNTIQGQSNSKSWTDYNPNTGVVRHDSSSNSYYILKEIIIEGNERTKEKIISREINSKPGDTIFANAVSKELVWIKNRIFNTTLFLRVDINFSGPDSIYKTLHVLLKERFYFIPFPSGGLADRNFNEWWVDRNADLSRIDWGLSLKQKNIWGLNHTLTIKGNVGFNKKIEATYHIPYIDKKLKTGLQFSIYYIINRQVAYRSFEHKLDFVELPRYGRQRFNASLLFSRRNKFYSQHQWGPYYLYSVIPDSIAKLNPNYFLDTATYQHSLGVKYNYTYDKRNFIYYPLKGYYLRAELDGQYLVSKTAMGVASLRAEYTHFFALSKIIYFAAGIRGKVSLPTIQPYFSQRGLGYNRELISGYELYVIDGQSYGLLKTNLKFRLFAINPTIKLIPIKKFRTVPISAYFKIYGDAGYVADNTFNPDNNFLSNRLLIGGGAGLDIVTYYDVVGRIEYSINRFGQTGIYLHLKAGL